MQIVAITNHRAFDLCSLLSMGMVYLFFFLNTPKTGRRRVIILGIIMLLTAVILNQAGHLIPVHRASPTMTFSDIHLVSEMTTINAKSSSKDSFPGDHGMMLIIFACFMWRYYRFSAFIAGLVIIVVFSLPRIMIGAHWFTDIAVGSLSVVLVGLSWWLLTPACDNVVGWLEDHLPMKQLFLK